MRGNDSRKKHHRGSSPSNQDIGHECDDWGVDWMGSSRLVFEDDPNLETATQGSDQEPQSDAQGGEKMHPGRIQSKAAE